MFQYILNFCAAETGEYGYGYRSDLSNGELRDSPVGHIRT